MHTNETLGVMGTIPRKVYFVSVKMTLKYCVLVDIIYINTWRLLCSSRLKGGGQAIAS